MLLISAAWISCGRSLEILLIAASTNVLNSEEQDRHFQRIFAGGPKLKSNRSVPPQHGDPPQYSHLAFRASPDESSGRGAFKRQALVAEVETLPASSKADVVGRGPDAAPGAEGFSRKWHSIHSPGLNCPLRHESGDGSKVTTPSFKAPPSRFRNPPFVRFGDRP